MTARKNEWELDKLVTQTDITKRMSVEEIEAHSKEGAFIFGLSMQVRRPPPTGRQAGSTARREAARC